jgi:hypothetical protein
MRANAISLPGVKDILPMMEIKLGTTLEQVSWNTEVRDEFV